MTYAEETIKILWEGDATAKEIFKKLKVMFPDITQNSASAALTRLQAEGVISRDTLRDGIWSITIEWLENKACICPQCGVPWRRYHCCN